MAPYEHRYNKNLYKYAYSILTIKRVHQENKDYSNAYSKRFELRPIIKTLKDINNFCSSLNDEQQTESRKIYELRCKVSSLAF